MTISTVLKKDQATIIQEIIEDELEALKEQDRGE
jgi:hypothetical protein